MPPSTRVIGSTPQPLPSIPVSERFSYESELWDDYANVVFTNEVAPVETYPATSFDTGVASPSNLPYLEIPCPVAARLDIRWTSLVKGEAAAVDVVMGFIASVALGAYFDPAWSGPLTGDTTQPLAGGRAFDFPPGNHIVALYISVGAGSADVTLYQSSLVVRRGRKP